MRKEESVISVADRRVDGNSSLANGACDPLRCQAGQFRLADFQRDGRHTSISFRIGFPSSKAETSSCAANGACNAPFDPSPLSMANRGHRG